MLKMAPIPLLAFFLLTRLVLPSSAQEYRNHSGCEPFSCGKLGPIHFPFNNMSNPECGVVTVDCSEDMSKIQFKDGGHCSSNSSIFLLINETSSKLYNCSHSHHTPSPLIDYNQTKCGDYDFYCNPPNTSFPYEQQCQNIMLPFPLPLPLPPPPPYSIPLPPRPPYSIPPPPPPPPSINITFQVQTNPVCLGCLSRGGKCDNINVNQVQCIVPRKGLSKQQKLGLGLGIGFVVLFAMMGLAIIMWCRKQKRAASRNIDDPNMNMNMEDPEGASGYLGVLVFSYKELTEATNNFDADRELGDGGFGTVYHGKLKDGREVAVKRLYEHNYKRLEQFINEIQILAGLRHKNLVSLYGCTSRRSRELLLVYEYIPNGTVADHLHGDRAKTSPLTWPIRLSVAIETARALAYLHASDIVHRDVKTNNILLDNNFCVKVADFGLSRLFPSDVTHVSTAPQGTPGYVDPEYHQCYQLTSKSDVYSFGVVLVELLSSMPAVDITRHRHEINLSNLAISKIQKQAYNELIDQDLGFDSDTRVRTMTIAVAELAFECLQQDKEMRPTMDEVLERLMRIEDGKIETKVVGGSELSMSTVLPPPPSPECDEIGLLKNIKQEQPPSPNAVTENWLSSTSTTPNFSG
ncbi:LEAF RUST 10 DISEASE-RESISTANCE LOCUS RECEPTOR-LIKE PROTEIN KINASE-like 1.1 isoform X6 [Humulus lupulus]|uniref:LEAF RUST 10 DISEASE-RESISTANCE LOCUS RECEPTOR-LIKE PROTEIN KINASE-like 1.1 isoform X6 n=1 Tax=Humulus lupulus TaxID=3486 RepID=UPI002B40AB1C|nr:LEAF RUST 10 DISEASE-RESISTANCE LOCUS RECEPTOR-LIKE PROTEIN KINASE-like 1.1 isoform X6 [Humulus lupulus]